LQRHVNIYSTNYNSKGKQLERENQMLFQERNVLQNRLKESEESKMETQLHLKRGEVEHSHIMQTKQSISRELSDLRGEYERLLIEFRNGETERLELQERLSRIKGEVRELKKQRVEADKLLADKERIIGEMTRDFGHLRGNFRLIQQKNEDLNKSFKRKLKGEGDILQGIDRNKDLSREIEEKINSVKNMFGRTN
jgi:chromosome segregation ATPase